MSFSAPAFDPEEAAFRLRRCVQLHNAGRELALAGLKIDHPEATRDELIELLKQRLDRQRAKKWSRYAGDTRPKP